MALNFCNNNSLSAITSIPAAISGGSLNLISTQTASSSSNLSFTSGIDSTYKEYIFRFYHIHPQTNGVDFTFNLSTDGGSNFNVTKTTTFFFQYHTESGSSSGISQDNNSDLAQSTNYQVISWDPTIGLANDDDHGLSGILHLFEPSSTVFAKNFLAQASTTHINDGNFTNYIAGYGNTTSAINAVDFKMSSGNIDAGVIKLYGVS